MSQLACEEVLVRILLLLIGALGAKSITFQIRAFDGDSDVILSCSQTFSSWTFNGSPLNIDGLHVHGSDSSIALHNVDYQTQGTYQCLDSIGSVIRTFDLKIIARPSFAGCDPTSATGSSCSLLPINSFTSSNISFNASITYSNATTKPVINKIKIEDNEGTNLVTCSKGSTSCLFTNTFAQRAQIINGDDSNILEKLLIVVQDVSLNDSGSYSLTAEYFKSQTSSNVLKYTATVDVNVTLAEGDKMPNSQVTLVSSPIAASLDTVVSSTIPAPASQVSTTLPPHAPATTPQPRPTSSSQASNNVMRTTTEPSAPPIEPPTDDNSMIHVFAGAVVGTFVFTIIVCLIIVTAVLVSRQRIRRKKKSESSSSFRSDSSMSSTAMTGEGSSDPLHIASSSDQTEERLESVASKEQTMELRHISISESFSSGLFVDSTPPEPPTGNIPHLSDEKNSTPIDI